MKKVIIAGVFGLLCNTMIAQNVNKLQTAFLLNRFEEAKTELDAVTTSSNSRTPPMLLWKARVYSCLFADVNLRKKYATSGQIALTAFNEYLKVDTTAKLLTTVGLGVVNNLYVTYLREGLNLFQKQQWDSASFYLYNAYLMGEHITRYNLKNNGQALDTLSVTYAGFAAHNAGRRELAVQLYTKLADAKIGGKDYQNIYQYLLYHYLENNDKRNFETYLAVAMKFYPQEKELWNRYKSEFQSKNP